MARYPSLRTSSGELKAALKGKGQGLRRPSQHSLRTNYKALTTKCLWPQASMPTAQLLAPPLWAMCCGTSKLTLTHHWQTAPGREVLSVLGSSVPQTKTREFSVGCVVQPGALTRKPHGCGEWPALPLHIWGFHCYLLFRQPLTRASAPVKEYWFTTEGKPSHSWCCGHCALVSQEVSWCSSFVSSHMPIKMKSTLSSPGYPTASGGTGQPLPLQLKGSATSSESLTVPLSQTIIPSDCGSCLLWMLWGSEVTEEELLAWSTCIMGTISALLSTGPCSVTHGHLLFILTGWCHLEDPWPCFLRSSQLVTVCGREGLHVEFSGWRQLLLSYNCQKTNFSR